MTSPTSKPDGMAQEVYEGLVVARRLREELGLRVVEPVDCIVELVEERLALEVMIAPLGGAISGFYLPVAPVPIVAVEQNHPVQRQRFTIAHELGHHALGHSAAPRIHGEIGASAAGDSGGMPTPAAGGSSALPTPAAGGSQGAAATAAITPATHDAGHYTPRRAPNADERGANAFAGELLIPEEGARVIAQRSLEAPPLDQVVRLSAHFGVSALAAVVKLQTLGVFENEQARVVRRELRAGAHYARYSELQLAPLDDALQRHADAGGGPRCSPAARRAIGRLRAEVDARA